MSPLAKIPLLIAVAFAVQTTTTPPHAPPASSERAPSTRLEFILSARSFPATVRLACWVCSLVEICAIIAVRWPSSPLSSALKEYLEFGGDLGGISCTPVFATAALFTVFGGFLRWLCYRALGRLFTFEMSIRNDHRLVTEGPYSVVRHPGYTAVICAFGGALCCYTSSGSWLKQSGFFDHKFGKGLFLPVVTIVLAITLSLMNRMPKEDQALKQTFGSEWDKWAKKVPYRLVPYVY